MKTGTKALHGLCKSSAYALK